MALDLFEVQTTTIYFKWGLQDCIIDLVLSKPLRFALYRIKLFTDIANALTMYRKVSRNSDDYKRMKSYRGVVAAFNSKLESFYSEHKGSDVTPEIKEFVY